MYRQIPLAALLLSVSAACFGSQPDRILGAYRGTLDAPSGPLMRDPGDAVIVTLTITSDAHNAGRYLSALSFDAGSQLLTEGRYDAEAGEFEDEESIGPKEASALVALTCRQSSDRSLDCSYQSLSTGHGYRFHLAPL